MEVIANPTTDILGIVAPRRGDIANRVDIPQKLVQGASSLNRVDIPPKVVQPVTLHINYLYKVVKGRSGLPQHFVADEPFLIDISGNLVILRHRHWSLRGRGRTLVEAERNLIENAREDAAYYRSQPVDSMTVRALALRDFILRCLLYTEQAGDA